MWIDIVTGIVSVIVVLFGGLWAYTKYVLERGFFPPIEFTIDCKTLGVQRGKQVIEILLRVKNIGSSTLVAKDIAARVRYIEFEEDIDLFRDPKEPTFGRVNFRHVQTGSSATEQQDIPSFVPIMPHDTFVQAKVDQSYTLVTAIPQSASFVLVKAQFYYVINPSSLPRVAMKLSRYFGLIHYSLDDVTEPHTVERSFTLRTPED